MRYSFRIISSIILFNSNSHAQLVVDNTTNSPAWLIANVLVGSGVSISNVQYNGSTVAATAVQQQVGEFSGSSSIGIASGIIMGTGDVQLAIGPNLSPGATLGGTGAAGTDPDLNAISSAAIFDQCVIEFDFIPVGDSIKFNYSFGSEEYLEYVFAGFNDAFGFFLSGPGIAGPYSLGAINIATVPGTSTPVSIDNVNNVTNPSYYIDNPGGVTIQYDGFTVVMQAKAAVQCGKTYHIKLAICDAGDGILDSGVFLEGGSFTSEAVEVDLITTSGTNTIIEGCSQGGTFGFTRPSSSDTLSIPIYISGNAVNGTDYTPIPSNITFLPGQDSVGLSFLAIDDLVPEGTDSVIITIVNINSCGDTIISTATVYIVDPTPLAINLGPDLSVACTGNTITLDPNPIGGYTPYTYTWSTGATTPTISQLISTNTQVFVTVNGQCGTTDTDTLNITIVPPVPQFWNAPVFSTYCPGDTIEIGGNYVSGGSSPFTFLWVTGNTDSSIFVAPNDTSTYAVTITDWCGLDTTLNIVVNVRNPSPIDVEINGTTVCSNIDGSATIVPTASGGNGAISYTWTETSPGTIASINANGSVIVNNAATGQFIVTVIDECRITDSDTASIVVEPCNPIIPNIVTPNGDGINDVFYITNLDRHPMSEVLIFNRWGLVMYENADYKNDYSPNDLTDGVYFYLLKLTDGSDPSLYHGFFHVNKVK